MLGFRLRDSAGALAAVELQGKVRSGGGGQLVPCPEVVKAGGLDAGAMLERDCILEGVNCYKV